MTELDTGTEDLLARVEDGVAVLTMNRPKRRNALSPIMLEALDRTLAQLEQDDEVGCVVLTGAGGAFCAGGDVQAMAEGRTFGGLHDSIARQRRVHRGTSGRLWAMPKPVVAMLPGAAAGAGLALALACDLRYAANNAILTTAFARVGFSGDFGGTWLLTQLVGAGKARELYYFSERLNAAQAAELGIVNAVFEPDELEREVLDRARRLAHGPRLAYRYMKENLNRATYLPFEDCLDAEADYQILTGDTDDHREAAAAFVEKREPRFTGR